MLKEMLLKKLRMQSGNVSNAIIQLGDTDDSGKGKHFKSRFLQPGLAGYPGQYGNALIRKENLDRFVHTLRNKPVVINHKDNITDDDKVGEVFNVWFNPEDGWYWCDGIITDETAQNLIQDKGWSVSCSYDFTKFDDQGGTENNIPYDIEFLDGEFTHLAIVNNPRYERANIVFNSKTVENFNPNHDEEGKFCKGEGINPHFKEELKQVIDKAKNNPNERQKLVIGKVSKDLQEKAKQNGYDISEYNHDIDVSGTRHSFKNHGNEKKETLRGQIAITDEDFERIPEIIYGYDDVHFGEFDEKGTALIKYHKQFDDGTSIYAEEIRTRQKTLTLKSLYKRKNKIADNSCTFTDFNPQRPEYISNIIITDISENFNPDITKHEVQNTKETDMALLEELKKLINTVENGKTDDEEPAKDDDGKKVDNTDVDKREILREADAIAMKPASEFKGGAEEKFRTLTKKLEEISYNKSSRGTTDNAETKEDEKEYKELKKEVKEDVENKKKCDNNVDNAKPDFFAKMNEVYNASMKMPETSQYISRADKLKAAEDYFRGE